MSATRTAITAFFGSLSDCDADRLRRHAAPDFVAFDMGERMTLEELRLVVDQARRDGRTYHWQITDPQVHIIGDHAWATWRNVGEVASDTQIEHRVWLESGILRRDELGWRMIFLHSSPAK